MFEPVGLLRLFGGVGRLAGETIRFAGLLCALLVSPMKAITQQRMDSDGVRTMVVWVRPPATWTVAARSTTNVVVAGAIAGPDSLLHSMT